VGINAGKLRINSNVIYLFFFNFSKFRKYLPILSDLGLFRKYVFFYGIDRVGLRTRLLRIHLSLGQSDRIGLG
jgi:hypothetical protein